MAILRNTAFNEISAAITDQQLREVEIGLTGFESEYLIYFSTQERAIADLRAAADWLESGKTLEYEERR